VSHFLFIVSQKYPKNVQVTEYFKAFIDMRSNRKVRKACKEYIVGMESEAEYIDRLEGILSQYTEEELKPVASKE